MARAPSPSFRSPISPHPRTGTVLAFDFGAKRIGVAVGDAMLRTAHPLAGVVAAGDAQQLVAVAKLVAEWQPTTLVVGVPRGTDGAAHEMTRRAERFARQLESRFGLAVERVDERYSSVAAESRLREAAGARRAARAARERTLDSYAAQLILEQYFHEAPQ
ncbi:MAG TPA: Holliday junction resolvase RuvX [Burkholderiales bacterium]|nr:Holliday junction resolvase RuvX [Burkholderiales bacterium]